MAHEVALAREKLHRAGRALASTSGFRERRARGRTAGLLQANTALKQEMAARKRLAERLQGEHDLNKALLGAQSPEAIAEAALRRLHHLLPCDQAALMELDLEHRRAILLARVRGGRVTRNGSWPLSPAQLRECRLLKSGGLHEIRNTPDLFVNPAGQKTAGTRIWPFIVNVPLIVEKQLVGILALMTDTPASLAAEHRDIAREIAAQLAVALQEARLGAALSAGREQLRALSLRLVNMQEAERRFIAHELHDEIGQTLTGLKLALQVNGSFAGARQEAITLVDDLMRRVRQLSLDLRPQVLDDLGLIPALKWLFQRYGKQAGLHVRFQHRWVSGRLPAQLETVVFRVVQEALTNVVRHAGVGEVTVRLWRGRRRRTVVVQVNDLGVGFDVPQALGAHASAGLVGMRERAGLLGGQFTLNSVPGAGTRLRVELPLVPNLPAAAARRPQI